MRDEKAIETEMAQLRREISVLMNKVDEIIQRQVALVKELRALRENPPPSATSSQTD